MPTCLYEIKKYPVLQSLYGNKDVGGDVNLIKKKNCPLDNALICFWFVKHSFLLSIKNPELAMVNFRAVSGLLHLLLHSSHSWRLISSQNDSVFSDIVYVEHCVYYICCFGQVLWSFLERRYKNAHFIIIIIVVILLLFWCSFEQKYSQK